MEQWRDIQGYEGMYQISNYGNVKSLNYNKTKQEKILKFGKNYKGYLQVHLCKDGKMKTFTVHRLVANAFIPNPNELSDVNHKDEDKTNNVVENLEWCDRKYNTNYGTRTERCSIKQLNDETKSKQVNQYSLDGTLLATYPSAHEVKRQLGFAQPNISACCNGKYKTAYGYKWRYKNEA